MPRFILSTQSERLDRSNYSGFIYFFICAYGSFLTDRIADCNNMFSLLSQMCLFVYFCFYHFNKQMVTRCKSNSLAIFSNYRSSSKIYLFQILEWPCPWNRSISSTLIWNLTVQSLQMKYSHGHERFFYFFYSAIAACLILFLPFVTGIAKNIYVSFHMKHLQI